MAKIHVLPQNLINLIAAGEVVERPSSALKELIENSIDAKASKIIVRLEDYGNKLIEIEDNGIGMNKEDAVLAFKQHATSKITSEDDLDKIETLGFRGEALASISSVSGVVELETKEDESAAIKLKIANGEISFGESSQTSNGTRISIHNIFENIPARKKFLKSSAVELKHLVTTFLNIALNHTHIHFELYHNNKEVYKLTRVDNLKDRIFEIWGGAVARNLYEQKIFNENGFKVSVSLGNPELGRKVNNLQFIYVNNRFILNKTISSAVQEAYRGFIHKDLRPAFFIFITINPSEIDVNIHPRKTEIRFRDNQQIFKIVYGLTRKILESETKLVATERLGETPTIDTINNSQDLTMSPPQKNYFKSSEPSFLIQDKEYTQSYPRLNQRTNNTPKYSKVEEALNFTEALLSDQNSTLKKVMQIFNTYIVFEQNNKVIFVDQHAAAEKILFEKLYKQMGNVITKPLLVPELIDLDASDKEIILSKSDELKNLGIIIDDFGGTTIQLIESPELLKDFNIRAFINEILDEDNSYSKSYDKDKEDYANLNPDIYMLLATEACHGSVRAGQSLSEDEMHNLLKDLLNLKSPYNCPHGRPTMWEISRDDIEKNFKRKI